MNGEEHPMKRGKHWRLWGDIDDSKQGPNSWNYLKPSFVKNGWTVVTDVVPDVGANGVVHYQRNGVEAWATVVITGTRVEVQMIEIAPVPVSLTLKAPASTPEQMDPAARRLSLSRPHARFKFPGWRTRPRPVLGDTERRRAGR